MVASYHGGSFSILVVASVYTEATPPHKKFSVFIINQPLTCVFSQSEPRLKRGTYLYIHIYDIYGIYMISMMMSIYIYILVVYPTELIYFIERRRLAGSTRKHVEPNRAVYRNNPSPYLLINILIPSGAETAEKLMNNETCRYCSHSRPPI